MTSLTVDVIIDILENNLFLLVEDADQDLVESGQLDSLVFVELLLAVEQSTGQQLAPKDLDLDDLRTPERIAKAFNELLVHGDTE